MTVIYEFNIDNGVTAALDGDSECVMEKYHALWPAVRDVAEVLGVELSAPVEMCEVPHKVWRVTEIAYDWGLFEWGHGLREHDDSFEETLEDAVISECTNLKGRAINWLLAEVGGGWIADALNAEHTLPWCECDEITDEVRPWDFRFEQMDETAYEGWCAFFMCDYATVEDFEKALADHFVIYRVDGGDFIVIGEW